MMARALDVALGAAFAWLFAAAWALDFDGLPLWRVIAGFIFMMMFMDHLKDAVENEANDPIASPPPTQSAPGGGSET